LILTLSNLGLTGKEIAEVIWLATQTDDEARTAIDVIAKPILEVERVVPLSGSPPEIDFDIPDPLSQAEIIPALPEKKSSLALPPNYKPIRVRDAPAISQALLLARALRPLARQMAVGLPTILDEAATVDLIAETGVWQSVLKQESEQWLDVALVFDTSPSMCLWQRLGTDVYRLLSRYGEFRDVRIWLLRHTDGKVELTARNGVPCSPKELLVSDHRRLVAIMSDCVAPAWHNGKMRELIATWSKELPVVVFHVFPERLWSRTALARSVTVEFQGKQPGQASDRLKPFVRSVWDRERLQRSLGQPQVRLPVVALEADMLSSWAQVVAGDRRSRALGIVWDAFPAEPSQEKAAAPSALVLKERLDSFLLTTSPITRELAGRLASAPVITLPILRLIKASMRPPASAVHMAELLMSGLLKISGPQVPTFENAERIAYELIDGEVRDRLRAGFLVGDALDVFEKISAYIAQGLGKSVNEFWALLRTPGMGTSSAETEFLNAFATVTGKILRGLGPEYEAIADSLSPPLIDTTSSVEEYNNLPLHDLEYEAAKFIDFPALQDCEYESASIIVILNRFDFETAIMEQGKLRLYNSVAWGYTEALSSGRDEEVSLDMISIPGGKFIMGGPEDQPRHRISREQPCHDVTLQPFYLGRYPITQAQWRVVASYPEIDQSLDLNPSRITGDNLPVEWVSWDDAQEFCNRLSVRTGRNYCLPSEAQWEYACRSGSETAFFYGGTDSPTLFNCESRCTTVDGETCLPLKVSSEVGLFPANTWGLYDMHGNIWEWCEDDWHSDYNDAPNDGSPWIEDYNEQKWVIRGGSWNQDADRCRSAYRGFYRVSDHLLSLTRMAPKGPSMQTGTLIGFRVCCSSPFT
jgi:formylglycine-generating enzyme required for sulfatase activity